MVWYGTCTWIHARESCPPAGGKRKESSVPLSRVELSPVQSSPVQFGTVSYRK